MKRLSKLSGELTKNQVSPAEAAKIREAKKSALKNGKDSTSKASRPPR